jgi:predicted kinase
MLICPHCGSERAFLRKPLLVVTGTPGTGKSTVCARLAGTIPEAVLLDLDVFVDEIGSAAPPDPDYAAFWRLMMRLAHEVSQNDLAVVCFSVMLPEQVLANTEALRYFDSVEFLCLTCPPETLRARLTSRRGWGAAAGEAEGLSAAVAYWLEFDRILVDSAGRLPTATILDSAGEPDRVSEEVRDWLVDRLSSRRGTQQ